MELPQKDPPEPSGPYTGPSDLPESKLAIPDDPTPHFMSSHVHSSENLDQALQAYQAYQLP